MTDQQASLLGGEEIKDLGLIVDGEDHLYRASTYDLSVGDIIPAGRRKRPAWAGAEYPLPPGGMVRVVSRESLRLPANITGHVSLKNELCRKGVLAINIGVADPGFVGPLSSTLINFGRADFVVKQGLPFMRVSFHRCPQSALAADSDKWSRDEYLERAREEVLAYSAATFLNIEETAAKAAKGAFGSFKRSLVLWATLAAVLFALLTIIVPIGVSYADRSLADRDRRETEIYQSIETRLEQQYEARLKVISDQVEKLRRAEAERPTKPRISSVTQ